MPLVTDSEVEKSDNEAAEDKTDEVKEKSKDGSKEKKKEKKEIKLGKLGVDYFDLL